MKNLNIQIEEEKEYIVKKQNVLKKAKNDAQRKWYANKVKKELTGENIRIVSKETKPQIVYSSKDRENNRLEKENFSDIIEVSREHWSSKI